MDEAAVILAAGRGTRMNSELPKVSHHAAGRPLVQWVVDACRAAGIERIVVIVGHRAEQVQQDLADYPVAYAEQTRQLGTGHAARQAQSALDGFSGRVFVLNGDMPLIDAGTLDRLRQAHDQARAAAGDAPAGALVTVVPEQSLPYGRVLRSADGNVVDIVEERDATDEQRALRELNAGFYAFDAPAIWEVLAGIDNVNQQAEYYLTDVPRLIAARGGRVVAVEAPAEVGVGVNTPDQLAEVTALLERRQPSG